MTDPRYILSWRTQRNATRIVRRPWWAFWAHDAIVSAPQWHLTTLSISEGEAKVIQAADQDKAAPTYLLLMRLMATAGYDGVISDVSLRIDPTQPYTRINRLVHSDFSNEVWTKFKPTRG